MITLHHVDRIPASIARINRLYEEQKREEAEKREKLTKKVLIVMGVVIGCMLLGCIIL